MAKPIREIKPVEPTPEELQSQALMKIIESLADSREAIIDMLEIARYLQEMGILAAVKALLEQRHEVGLIVVEQLNQPKMHHILKNAITLMELLGKIQPEQLQRLLNGLFRGLESAKQKNLNGKIPSLWDLAKYIRDPDVRISIASMMALLQGVGESLRNDSGQTHQKEVVDEKRNNKDQGNEKQRRS
ncbi:MULTISPECIES: DUF1641 domain-containing protein [unclassified Thermoactinomyces]|jgi:uncharacterized protein YjgD (DUF1641 family)|uniref:DUF1641 domain-containing protein n=1 Tax=unclassified Thermoactinomyces TaxID=2634588 RepID=UPI0018DC6365|nr:MULTISPECIES: DUF1641 domain-containing protein [unclassified Thermoactinomyces]MBH8599611.1 DUF1641 domain-containing protein [Thermoactinomyces sp. CICC 10523]MBH8605724.1 DUF1641 domain-containing protein [Thermoactinomyces sp. CICC 10522]MBH8609192.1 DUF1641 domain-containing protein [Thermoactinomyces sp. CICC 10521]